MRARWVSGLRTRVVWSLVDASVWAMSLALAMWFRLDFGISEEFAGPLLGAIALTVSLHLSLGWIWGPYAVGHELGSFEETTDLARTTLVSGAVTSTLVLVLPVVTIPRSVPLSATAIAVTGMFALRFLVRSRRDHRSAASVESKRALVFGAGSGGRVLVQSLVRDRASGLWPVALIDDDPRKSRLHFSGVKVRGTSNDIAAVAERYGASVLIIAAPSASAETVRAVSASGREAGLEVLILPAVSDLLGGRPTASDLRNLDVADLLGRKPVDLDMAAIAEQVSGRRVLVTGAGGSIGSELCRQLSRFGPSRLLMLDRDESGLHATQLSIEGRALLDSEDLLLCDIRDADALTAAFERTRPEVVFHAAALKHLTMLETYPAEAYKTNVVGTLNVLEAAQSVRVATFVNISTDKAARPTCVLGWSKRVAERLTAGYDERGAGRYVSVRFGNVLGSRGSVVTAFMEQIRRGGPVTVTHPEVERFFMLIPEACQLVLQASAIGAGKEVMVLEMGSPVKIADMARTMIDLSGQPEIEIVFTGLRPGEKLTEELFTPGEAIAASAHSLISQVAVPPLVASSAFVGHERETPEVLRGWMAREGSPVIAQGVS